MTTDVTISQTILTTEIVQPDGPSISVSVPAGPQIVVAAGPELSVAQTILTADITQADGPVVAVSVPAAPQIVVSPVGIQGPPGVAAETFESVAQNLASLDHTAVRGAGGQIEAITYALPGGGSITKTLGRVGGVLATITLSGDVPGGIDLVKTLGRDAGGGFAGASYSGAV
jgi:hypothetical protein